MKVRLIHYYTYRYAQPLLTFQFHEGSINTRYSQPVLTGLGLFQFHEGSINTRIGCTTKLLEYLFQFHEGSINTIYISNLSLCLLISIP